MIIPYINLSVSDITMYIIIVLLGTLWSSTAFDVNWIPADSDGPLPVSEAYRDSLRKLCTILDSGEAIPQEAAHKRHVIDKMCSKLKQTDSFVDMTGFAVGTQTLGYLVGAVVVMWGLYTISGIFYTKTTSNTTPPAADALREMRLKKFS